MKKEKIFAVSAGVTLGIACVSSCFSPTEVHADAGSFAGAVDYITTLADAEAVALGSSGGGIVAGVIMGIWMCTRNPIQAGNYYDMSALTTYTCYYKWDGKIQLAFVNIYPDTNFVKADGGYNICTAEHFDISVIPTTDATASSSLSSNNVICVGVTNYNGNGTQIWQDSKGTFTPAISNNNYGNWGYWGRFGIGINDDVIDPPDYYNYSAPFPVRFSSSAPLYPVIFQYGSTSSGLGSDLDPADPDTYIQNVVRPWVIENYPEYIYLLPDPPAEPEPTLDPSETMPGLPVIQLPTVPPPEYDMDLPEKMLEGAGFWFTALTEVLDEMGWLAIVIALAVIAIVLYYVF